MEKTALDILSWLAPKIIKGLASKIKYYDQNENDISRAVENHITEVINWASNVQFFGMSSPLSTNVGTISLDINTEPRRFRGSQKSRVLKQESDLLSDSNNYLLLGEPGSGKTTTVKRLSLLMFNESPISPEDIFQFPIVIRLREMKDGESLYTKISDTLGIHYEKRNIKDKTKYVDKNGITHIYEGEYNELAIGNSKIEDAIHDLLNETQAILLLDGLDELKEEHRNELRQDMVKIGLHLTSSKIIVTCRSGDYLTQMDNFTVLEISPLSHDQIISIKNKWLGPEDNDFIQKFGNLPYFDVANRPLMLTQLLFLYKHHGFLPDQPHQIYSQMIKLLLTEWDAQRGVRRESKYSGFYPPKKEEFLSALAYKLTYPHLIAGFTESDLVSAYLSICDQFNLPREEATKVSNEIQTHTGIIIAGPLKTYEFCHLSFQEFLCAQYIIKSAIDIRGFEFLIRYPAPLAIAVALSSTPGNWFGYLINKLNLNKFSDSNMASFLSRLSIERPDFEISDPLGFAILLLYRKYFNNSHVINILGKISVNQNVKQSLANSLKWYSRKQSSNIPSEFIEITPDTHLLPVFSFKIPEQGAFPRSLYSELNKLSDGPLFTRLKKY